FFLAAMSRGNHQKRSGPVSGAASFNSLRSTGRSEALLVLHVHEAADFETTVVRVVAVRLGEHDRTGVVEHVVGTNSDSRVPRGLPVQLQVVEGVGTGVALRGRLTIGVTVGVGARTVGDARLVHARVVAGGVRGAEVAHLPIHAQVRAQAEDARGANVADGDRVAVRVLAGLVVTAGVRVLPVDREVAEAGFRQLVAHADVVAFGLHLAEVGEAVEHAGDVAVRGAGDVGLRAAACIAEHVAVTQDAVDAVRDDHVLDLVLVPVDADVQALHPTRAPHQAHGLAGGGFRQEVRVGTGEELVRRLARVAGARHQALAQLHVADRHASGGAGRVAVDAADSVHATRIGVVLEAAADAAVEVVDRRSAEALGHGAADEQLVDRTPGEAELAVGGVTEVAVVG